MAEGMVAAFSKKMDAEMFSSKREILEYICALWPDELHIILGGNKNDSVNTSPPLWNVYENVEDEISDQDEWLKLSNWSFYQALDKLGRRRECREKTVLRPDKVSLRSFDTMMRRNLADESWRDERIMYESLSFF